MDNYRLPFQNQKILILAPVVKGRKGHYRELFEQIKKWGYLRVRIDGEVVELTKRIQLDRYKVHDIEIVIDRLEVNAEARPRISESMQLAMKQGKGIIMVQPFKMGKIEEEYGAVEFYSRHLMCPTSGISYDEPQPNLFSFNSPKFNPDAKHESLTSISACSIKPRNIFNLINILRHHPS